MSLWLPCAAQIALLPHRGCSASKVRELSVLAEHGAENLQVKTGKRAVEGGKGLLFKFHFLITSVLSLNLEADKSLGSRCSSIIFLLSPSKANPAGMSRGFGVHQQGCGPPAVPKKASECIMVGF